MIRTFESEFILGLNFMRRSRDRSCHPGPPSSWIQKMFETFRLDSDGEEASLKMPSCTWSPSAAVFAKCTCLGMWALACMDKNICKLQNSTCARHSLSFVSAVDWPDTLSVPLMLLRPPRNMSLGRWLLVRKKSKHFGSSSFCKFYYTRQKNPFSTLRTVLHREKNP